MESFSYSLPPVRILVVDDDLSIQHLLGKCLVSWGYFVHVASNGRDALELVEESPFDILITDINMPEMDGLELIRRIRAAHVNIDIIAMTGFLKRYRYADVISAGAADFLTKPFGLDELEAKLVRIVRDREERVMMAEQLLKDPLTGVYNRMAMDAVLRKEVVRAGRYKYPLSLMFIDIDKFKAFNDHKGHVEGDALLKQAAAVFLSATRADIDFVFRYGGDEFLILLVYVDKEEVSKVASRIIQEYDRLNAAPTSLSIGIASRVLVPIAEGDALGSIVKAWLEEADRALYEAKKIEGHGVVVVDL